LPSQRAIAALLSQTFAPALTTISNTRGISHAASPQLDEPALITELVRRTSGHSPHATAVECGEPRLTWRKLDARIRHVASGLRASMVRPGRALRRAVAQPPGCLGGAVRGRRLTGTTAVIPRLAAARRRDRRILRREQVTLLFLGAEFIDLLERIRRSSTTSTP